MNVNAYEMKLPCKYTELSMEEMEYDGCGIFGAVFGAIAAVVAPIAGAIITGVTVAAIGAAICNPVGAAAVIALIVIGGVTGYYAFPF